MAELDEPLDWVSYRAGYYDGKLTGFEQGLYRARAALDVMFGKSNTVESRALRSDIKRLLESCKAEREHRKIGERRFTHGECETEDA